MSKETPRFIMLVGLPASGKSTVAEELMKDRDDILYLSSDKLRQEKLGDVNNQNNNTDIFEVMRKESIKALKEGKHVIYDATSINRKRRKGLLQQLPKDVEKIALYMATPYDEVIERNEQRERVVPQDVIERMYKNMHVPIYSEGWDKIIFEHTDDVEEYDMPKQFTDAIRAGVLFGREGYELMQFLASYFTEFFKIYDMPHDSKWHSLSVSRHIYQVYKYILDNYEGEDKEVMLWTALLHDVGKYYCKSFVNRKGEETVHANFIGHENVGAQIAIPFLKTMNFDDEFIHKVATLIQFHMYLLDENASKEKLKGYVGNDTYIKLDILRDADTKAH